mgnify:CR=1 FL=1
MELKLVMYYIRTASHNPINRTIMELKHIDAQRLKGQNCGYQSHHHGIETDVPKVSYAVSYTYQSHHHGIETNLLAGRIPGSIAINRTIMELKPKT